MSWEKSSERKHFSLTTLAAGDASRPVTRSASASRAVSRLVFDHQDTYAATLAAVSEQEAPGPSGPVNA